MKVKTLDWTDWLLLGVLAVAAFMMLVVVPFGWQQVGRALVDASTAAWVQALGSIAAIVWAVQVSQREARERRRRAALEAFVVASRIKNSVGRVRNLVFTATAALEMRSEDMDAYFRKLERMLDSFNRMPTIAAADVAALASVDGMIAANLGSALDRISGMQAFIVSILDLQPRPTQVPFAGAMMMRNDLALIRQLIEQAVVEVDAIAKVPPAQG